jgi:1,4-dihydroxy-6-naphthoate synthase
MQPRLLRLGHSPDPDDAFMFYGLAKGLVPSGPYQFEHVLQDIQTLNQRAMRGELEITAISIHAYPYVADKYVLTSCGSSMGDQYGPMIVCRADDTARFGNGALPELRGKMVAIPGELTTAFLSLQLALGKAGTAFDFQVVAFDEIPGHVRDGKSDAGLLIHEGQLTYQASGLHKLLDLGEWWHAKTGLPLPLGGNCVRKDLGTQVMQEVTDIIKQSIVFSLRHRAEAVKYALRFGRDLDQPLADRFVGMYVNDWTVDYGPRGREAISRLLKAGADAGLVPPTGEVQYITAK